MQTKFKHNDRVKIKSAGLYGIISNPELALEMKLNQYESGLATQATKGKIVSIKTEANRILYGVYYPSINKSFIIVEHGLELADKTKEDLAYKPTKEQITLKDATKTIFTSKEDLIKTNKEKTPIRVPIRKRVSVSNLLY